jgi:hypothetical protein
MLGACLTGVGIARVKAIGVRDLLSRGVLVELLPDWYGETFPLYALYPSSHLPAAKVRAFIDFVVEVIEGIESLDRGGSQSDAWDPEPGVPSTFTEQISAAQASEPPYPGCLFANTMTEIAPHDAKIAAPVRAHNERFKAGFRNALSHASPSGKRPTYRLVDDLSAFLAISAQGLWSMSRTTNDIAQLRHSASTLLQLIEHRLAS